MHHLRSGVPEPDVDRCWTAVRLKLHAAMCCRLMWTPDGTSSRSPALERCAACWRPGPWTTAEPGEDDACRLLAFLLLY